MSEQTQAVFNSVGVVVLTAILSFVAAMYWHNKRQGEKRNDEIADLKRQMAILQIPVQQMNAAFQAMLVKQLTHFHTKELDELLKKLGPPMALTAEDRARLTILLQEREADVGGQIDDSERDAAHMLPMVMKRVADEMDQSANMNDLILVAVPKPSDDTNR